MTTVSVVLPVGAVDDLLAEQFAALACQRFPYQWELVVVLNTDDAGARTNLDEVVRAVEAPEVRIIDASDRRSAAHARNVGARAARSDLLAFCDGDDIADPGWLTAIVDGLERHRAVGGFLEEELLAIPGQQHWRPPATPGGLPRFLGHPYLVSANMGVHRELFEAAGGFDETLLRGEDIAFSWALLDLGVELGYEPDAVIHYRHRAGLVTMLRQHYLYGRGMSQLLAHRPLPGQPTPSSRALFRPNGQRVEHRSPVYVLRRSAIGAGRLVGLMEVRLTGA
jgi:GT2 family glycosyltransferase